MKVSSIGKVYSPNTKKTNFNNDKKNPSPAFGVDIRYNEESLKPIKDTRARGIMEEYLKKMEKRYQKVGSDNINIVLIAQQGEVPAPLFQLKKVPCYSISAIVQYKDVQRARKELLEAFRERSQLSDSEYGKRDKRDFELLEKGNPRVLKQIKKPVKIQLYEPVEDNIIYPVLEEIYNSRIKEVIEEFTYYPNIDMTRPKKN